MPVAMSRVAMSRARAARRRRPGRRRGPGGYAGFPRFGIACGGQCGLSLTRKAGDCDEAAPTREESPMYIGLGTLVVIVLIVLLILFLRR